jgi:hypothetical protein
MNATDTQTTTLDTCAALSAIVRIRIRDVRTALDMSATATGSRKRAEWRNELLARSRKLWLANCALIDSVTAADKERLTGWPVDDARATANEASELCKITLD